MQLNIYLKQNAISVRDFAASAGLSLDTVYKYIRNKRRPNDPVIIQRIAEITSGAVTANDFYDLPAKPNGKHKNGHQHD